MRRFHLSLLALVFLGCCPQTGQVRTKPRAGGAAIQPLCFVQMADPQIGMMDGKPPFTRDTANFRAAVERANRIKPAFVVISGDFAQNADDAEQMRTFRQISGLLEAGIPLRLVSGNHDVGNTPTPSTLARYRERFGPDWYSFDAGGSHFIVLDSSLIASPKGAPDEAARQHQWLRSDLSQAAAGKPVHTIVLMHHALFLARPDEKDDYFSIPQEPRAELIRLFQEYGVSAVYSGHVHGNVVPPPLGTMRVVATGPVGQPLRKDPSGLRVVKLSPDRITDEYVPLE